MNFFTDILEELCLDNKQRYFPFWNFQNTYFTKRISINAYDSSSSVLCNGMCNVILYACKN